MSWVSWTSLFNRHQILEPKSLCGKFAWQRKLLFCAKLQLRVELVRSNWWSHRNSSGPFLPPIVLEKNRFSCSWCSWHWWQAQWHPGNHPRRSFERFLSKCKYFQIRYSERLLHSFWPKWNFFQIRPQQPFLKGTFMPAPSSQWKPLLKYNWIKKETCWIIWITYKKIFTRIRILWVTENRLKENITMLNDMWNLSLYLYK